MASVPHFSFPLRLAADGGLATVEQDTIDDVAQCVRVLVDTAVGERVELPAYGIEDPSFTEGIDRDEIRRAVDEWEPRAALMIESEPDQYDEMIENVIMDVGLQS